MPSTLYSIYTAQRALAVNQAAIDVINSNVANMNTKGYSKQRVELSQMSSVARYESPLDVSQQNMGSIIDAVTRNRDVFMDNSFRQETTDLNYYKEYSDIAVQIENTLDELGDTGLNQALNNFYNGLSQLAANPNDFVVRNSLVQNAETLAIKFNDLYSELQTMRTNLVGDISEPTSLNESKLYLTIDDLNSKLESVADLNQKINLSTAQGVEPNSLMDERDMLLDQISEYIPVTMKNEINNTVTITLGTVQLVSGGTVTGSFSIQAGATASNPSVLQVQNESGYTVSSDAYSLVDNGKIGAMLQAGGSDTDKLTINGLITSLNTLANQFATAINAIQTNGRYIDSSASPHELSDNQANPLNPDPYPATFDANPVAFFVDSDLSGTITAGNIAVHATILGDPYQIAAASLSATVDETGNGANALLMAQVRDTNLPAPVGTSSQRYLTNMIGQLGIKSKNLQDNQDIKETILGQVNKKRESITGVNLDEELADLIRFQKAYEASAKVMSTISENLSIIMNMVG